MIRIELPMPPSVNALFRNVPGRGRVKTKRYLTWIQAAGWAVKEQRPAKIAGPYCLWLYCNRPDKRRRDLANLEKAISDLLVSHGIVEDDSLCAELHLYWAGTGRDCVVNVEPARPVAMAVAA
jgi:Holliday junction resolvase RusA-like endonuclease